MRVNFFLVICLFLLSNLAQAESPIPITVYRSPTCGCCGGWIDHLKQNNFVVTDIPTGDMQAIKKKHGITDDIASCHTALTGGYVIEGHVPANDIKALLRDRPNVFGIAVPRMPNNAPGMEAHAQSQPAMNFTPSNSVPIPKAACSVNK